MILRINGVIDPEGSGGVMDRVNDFADWVIGQEADLFVAPVTNSLADWAHSIIVALNAVSAEIITLGVIACAAGMMVGPIMGSNGKWLGRLFIVLWGGVIWRMILP